MIVTSLKFLISACRWLLSAVIVWLAKIAAWILAPLGALFFYYEGGREYLMSPWRWMTTHDAPVDEWWLGGYGKDSWLRRTFGQGDYETKALLRWWCRVLWIWRNSAYQVAHWLGYDQRGMKLLYIRDEGLRWDSGVGNLSFWLAENERGQIGWMLQWQWYWWGQRCLEVYLGWKLFRTDPDQRCMAATRISPFREYEIRTA